MSGKFCNSMPATSILLFDWQCDVISNMDSKLINPIQTVAMRNHVSVQTVC